MISVPLSKQDASPPPIRKHRRGTRRTLQEAESIPFIDCFDEIYYAQVSIGTPPQTFKLILDTGSSDTWVVSSSCTGEGCPAEVSTNYDSSSSSTFSPILGAPPFSIEYMDGDRVSGSQVSDTIAFSPQMSITNQEFAEITDSQGFTIVCSEDGILGMAFQLVSQNEIATPLQNLFLQNQIPAAVFGFYLSGDSALTSNSDGVVGELTLGGYDHDHYVGELIWVDLALRTLEEIYPTTDLSDYSDAARAELQYSGFWDVDVTSVILNDRAADVVDMSMAAGVSGAVVDTGTSILYGPRAQVFTLLHSIRAQCYFLDLNKAEDDQIYEARACSADIDHERFEFVFALVPCSAEPVLSFRLGGSWFNLTKADLLYREVPVDANYDAPNEYCASGQFIDCAGQCQDEGELFWDGDGECDKGQYGLFLNCPRFACDEIDCAARDCRDEEMCMTSIAPNSFGDNSWLMGDTFMRPIYTAHDYTNKKMGFAYSKTLAATASPTRLPSPSPTTSPTLSEVLGSESPTASPTESPTARGLLKGAGGRMEAADITIGVAAVAVLLLLLFVVKKCGTRAVDCVRRKRGGAENFTRLSDFDDSRVSNLSDFSIGDDEEEGEEAGAEMVTVRLPEREAAL